MSWIKRKSHNENSDREKNYSFVRLINWLFLVASILMLIFTYYRSEITFQGERAVDYFKYYLISLAGILFWGLVLRLREEIRANIVTLVTSLVVGLYIVEGGLTYLGVGQSFYRTVLSDPVTLAAELGIEYDQRTKLEVIEDLIAEGVDAVPAIRPRDVLTIDEMLLPLGGISNKTTVGENESGRRMIYLSDRYGFNNPDSEWDSKEVEWLLTGDSFTEGVAVQQGESIAGHLRDITQESAINLGRSGNGPLIQLAVLTEYARAIKPKRVLWIYYYNDLLDNLKREENNPLLIPYMEDGFSQNLISRQKEIDTRLERYIFDEKVNRAQALALASGSAQAEEALALNSARLYKNRWTRLYAIRSLIDFDDDFSIDANDPLFAKILTKAKARVESWGGELYFVYLPDKERYHLKAISHDKFRKKAGVIDVVKQLDIKVIDIHKEVFADHSDPLSLFPLRLFGHYNKEGYRMVAKAIINSID